MNNILKTLTFLTILLFSFGVKAESSLTEKLSGKILLQTEAHGEAWYINPQDKKRYFLARPSEAFEIMRQFGIGIKNSDLEKIAVAYGEQGDLSKIDNNFSAKQKGKIFLQTEKNGEAWYVNPDNKKRYYLGKPLDAFKIMRELSLGITNQNLEKISQGTISQTSQTDPVPITEENNSTGKKSHADTIKNTASAIRSGDRYAVESFFVPEIKKAIAYTMDFLDNEGKLTLGNIISGAILEDSNENEATYKSEVYFSMTGKKVPLYFHIKKQTSGEWLMTNL